MTKNKILLVALCSSLLALGSCGPVTRVTSSSSSTGSSSSTNSAKITSSSSTNSSVSSSSSSSESIEQFTITFLNEDGTEIQKGPWAKGTLPSCPAPTKASDAEFTYAFKGWNPEVVPAVADATYRATFSKTLNQYTITFVDDGGTVLQSGKWDYGSIPSCPDPTKEADAQYRYAFRGWNPQIVKVVSDATYTAVYDDTLQSYTIRFVDEDGTLLQTSEWDYGTTPTYNGTTPTKAADDTYTYVFNGWDSPLDDVEANKTYTAVYAKTSKHYSAGFTFTPHANGYEVSAYSGVDTAVIVPSYYEGEPVITLGDSLFKDNAIITSLSLPETLKEIDDEALSGMSALTSFSVSSENPYYSTDGKALYDKDKKTILQFALASGTSYQFLSSTRTIGDSAFEGASKLTQIIMVDDITLIEDYAFKGCTGLSYVCLPSCLTRLGAEAFRDCTSLGDVFIPIGLLRVGSFAFKNTHLPTKTVGSLTYIGNGSYPYYFLTENNDPTIASVSLNSGCKFIDNGVFAHNESLVKVTLNEGLRSIGMSAFAYDSALLSISLPNTLFGIEDGAFMGCSSLESVSALPCQFRTLGDEVFLGCSALASFSVDSRNLDFKSDGKAIYSYDGKTLYVYAPLAGSSYTIPEGVTTLEYEAFAENSSLTSIGFPKSVSQIQNDVFKDCTKLTAASYAGTKAEWAAVDCFSDWAEGSALTSITCSDGSVTL